MSFIVVKKRRLEDLEYEFPRVSYKKSGKVLGAVESYAYLLFVNLRLARSGITLILVIFSISKKPSEI